MDFIDEETRLYRQSALTEKSRADNKVHRTNRETDRQTDIQIARNFTRRIPFGGTSCTDSSKQQRQAADTAM